MAAGAKRATQTARIDRNCVVTKWLHHWFSSSSSILPRDAASSETAGVDVSASSAEASAITQILAGKWIDIYGDFGAFPDELDVDYGTTLTLRGSPINATAEERKAFEDGLKGMQQGFAGTFDQLAEHLAKAKQ